MNAHISKEELDGVKKAITNAEAGRPSLIDLARAYEICARAGATKTLDVIREHIHRLTPGRHHNILPNFWAGILSGALVSLTVGRLVVAGTRSAP